MEYRNFIENALKDSSKIALQYFGKVTSITKPEDNNQVLTEADLAIGKLIVKAIQDNYPNHNIIDEEAGIIDNGSEFTWVVDPVDGTSNFANGLPMYAISIGLLQNGAPIAGGVALPAFFEIYTAERGMGALCNGKTISATKESRLLSMLVAYAIDGHQENPSITREECKTLAELILNIRNLRSSGCAFDGIMTANGKYGAYITRSNKIWDNIGLHIISEEAGAIVTDFFGKPLDYSNPISKAKDNFTLLIAAPALHQEIQKIINDGK